MERNLSVLRPFGSPRSSAAKIELPVRRPLQDAVYQKLQALGVADRGPIIGMSPGSVWPTKRWAGRIRGAYSGCSSQRQIAKFCCSGGQDDAAVVHDCQHNRGGRGAQSRRQISLRELPAAIGRCRVFVSNDSGPMHVAVARDVPTVAVFCATTPDLGFYPYSGNAIVVQRSLACRQCVARWPPLSAGARDCIRQIRAQTVSAAVEKLLAGRATGNHAALSAGISHRLNLLPSPGVTSATWIIRGAAAIEPKPYRS